MRLRTGLNTKLYATALAAALISTVLFSTSTAWACDAAGKNTHVGHLMSVDAQQKTFTIKDAQSQGTITFAANEEIIDGLKHASGSIMVNYKEDGDKLTALGVTF